jgi:hypothetical protein
MAFKLVAGLWVTPDFTEVEAGRREPPFVNHSKVDFAALAVFLGELFPYGPKLTLQVTNDTIDQVTIHMRQIPGAPARPSIRCEDFGEALLARSKSAKGTVVNVRNQWQTLHYLKDRDRAPPPIVIPFVVSFVDWEDAMIWHASTRPALGLLAFDVMESLRSPNKPLDHEGTLPPSALQKLEALFGTPFSSLAVLDQMASDPPPAYAPKQS